MKFTGASERENRARAFRTVSLAAELPGKLYLHSMPGRYEPLQTAWLEIKRLGITRVICLASLEEIGRRSPDYAKALTEQTLPCRITHFPIADFDAPQDTNEFFLSARSVADSLRHGGNALVHCGAGMGRTGTFAIGVLLALGMCKRSADTRQKEAAQLGANPR